MKNPPIGGFLFEMIDIRRKFDVFCRRFDGTRAAAAFFFLTGVLLWTVPVRAALWLRYGIVLLLLRTAFHAWERRRRKKEAVFFVAGCVAIACFWIFGKADTAAKIVLALLFWGVCASAFPAVREKEAASSGERLGMAAAGVAAGVFSATLLIHLFRLNYLDGAGVFGAAAMAAAVTLALRPKKEVR